VLPFFRQNLDDSSQTIKEEESQENVETAKDEKEEGYAGSNSSEESDTGPSQPQTKLPVERRFYQLTDKCRKTLRLSSAQIVSCFSS